MTQCNYGLTSFLILILIRKPEATPPTKSGGILEAIPEFPALVITRLRPHLGN